MIKDKIKIEEGDITNVKVDAIVNAANTDLALGSGVAGAIRKKGGPQIQADCSKQAPVELGEAVVTKAGGLQARYVIHAAAMRMGTSVSHDSLKLATLNSLHRAEEKKLRSIAFPAVGTGVGGYKLDMCAKDMMRVVYNYFHDLPTSSIEEVHFVLYDRDAFDIFSRIRDELPED